MKQQKVCHGSLRGDETVTKCGMEVHVCWIQTFAY
jgi:hypothetical protein